jgi:hypothetical protein
MRRGPCALCLPGLGVFTPLGGLLCCGGSKATGLTWWWPSWCGGIYPSGFLLWRRITSLACYQHECGLRLKVVDVLRLLCPLCV